MTSNPVKNGRSRRRKTIHDWKEEMKSILALVLGCMIVTPTPTTIEPSPASIVKVTFTNNGEMIGKMIYTGADGGAASNPAKYWSLLSDAPEAAYEVHIDANEADKKTATIKGDISVSVEIRNKYSMGTTKTESLKLVRDDIDSDQWYIPEEELKRVQPTVARVLIVEEGTYRNGISKTNAIDVRDESKINQLLTMFPRCLRRPESSISGGWKAGHRLHYFLYNGEVVSVTVSLNENAAHWSCGQGDFKTQGDFLALMEELNN